jgi:hypothetical protein
VPVHDWTLVDAGVFHDFHTVWIAHLRSALNEGILPSGYYALAEQHAGASIADVLTLHAGPTPPTEPPQSAPPMPPDSGGVALADAPPRVRRRQTVEPSIAALRRTLAIRHVSGHRLIALVEILSPANKDRARHVEAFADKAAEALEAGIHLLVVDLFPPGLHDPHGMHAMIRQRLDGSDAGYELPPGEPLTLAAYAAASPPRVEVYLEHLAIGAALPPMPLFLRHDRYVNVPLDATYAAAYRGLPGFWRDVLEVRGADTT